MNDDTEERLRRVLRAEPRPRLSHHFAARLANRIAFDQRQARKEESGALPSPLRMILLLLVTVAATLLLPPAVVYLLVPAGFAGVLFRRELLVFLFRLAAVFLR